MVNVILQRAGAEVLLDMMIEDNRDGHTETLLELRVGVVEALVQTLGEQTPERGFPTARHAHQKQIAPMQRHRCRGLSGGAGVADGRAHRTALTVSFTMRGVRKISNSCFSIVLSVVLNR